MLGFEDLYQTGSDYRVIVKSANLSSQGTLHLLIQTDFLSTL